MKKLQGFTLMEMVIAMVILAIIMVGIGSYIEAGVKGYSSTVDRERLQSEARFLLARMTKEIRHAAPNSLSVSGISGSECLSFYPIIGSAAYYDNLPNNSHSLNISTFDDAKKWNSSDKIAVGFIDPSQYQNSNIVYKGITGKEDSLQEMAISSPITTASPAHRLYLYQDKISYCLGGTKIFRTANGQHPVMMAQNVSQFKPKVEEVGLNSNAIALIGLQFKDLSSQEVANYNHSVQVLNAL
ncbi:prepilin-type N-terminal cleavage/methylation domain-containing protein [Photobacterium damselae subsp. damselae]|uniref:PilW family protein n=1 Tax=Photobacterium damselae TaxID=38293 RepID=UPI000D066643|nr:prepilin-type N-terminal cleavage/methylation domain-containing protein [Photobacterium damselae]NVH46228.1 prepilin-type N-terminal cleavage/methylation domain-containing protein [Photobacterium damselae subsp. damselae]PSB79126.1 type IV prepilin, MshO [Photobacterium damselae subsp. damselae]